MNNIWKGTLIMVFIFLSDQFSKGVVQEILLPGEEKVLIPGFMGIVHIRDSDAALGSFAHWNVETKNAFLISFSLLIVLWAVRRLIMFRKDYFKILPYIFVVSGLLGNLVDRLLYGHVVSFIKISPWVFNVADISIIAAIIVSVFNIYDFFRKKYVSSAL